MAKSKTRWKDQHQFAQIPTVGIQRSVFNRSSGTKTAFDAGYLIPIWVDEALPGDTFAMRATLLGRVASLLYPIMDNIWFDLHFWSVPNRLLWQNWQRFMGERDPDPDSSTDYEVPQMAAPASVGHAVGSLSDYLGIPVLAPDLEHSSLWHRAYALIWNQWYRDIDLQDSAHLDTDDGPDDPADYPLLKRGKRHDYFTSCRPSPQKGAAVTIPLGTSAPVALTAPQSFLAAGVGGAPTFDLAGSTYSLQTNSSTNAANWSGTKGSVQTAVWVDPQLTTNIGGAVGTADLTGAVSATVNEMRQSIAVQHLQEREMRSGTRYTEIIKGAFHVDSDDARLQRPEYLGGGTIPLNVQQVQQTGPDSGNLGVGDLAAFGVGAQTVGWSKSFTEHCTLIGLVSARADLNYQEGLPRMFSRLDKLDFYWPELANLGEQAVLNKEIWAQGSDGGTDDEDVFGYQERYGEYRFKASQVTGKLRTFASGTLDSWHVAQSFATLPALNDTFIQETPPMARVIQVSTEPHFIMDSFFNLRCVRPMPVYSVPGLRRL